MNETLKSMCQNTYVKIAVSAVDQKKQTYESMQELVALYVAMKWINTSEATEILAYTESNLEKSN